MSEYLKSAAQLRKLAATISEPEAHRRIIAVAEEYEAIAIASAEGSIRGKPTRPLMDRVRVQLSRGKHLH